MSLLTPPRPGLRATAPQLALAPRIITTTAPSVPMTAAPQPITTFAPSVPMSPTPVMPITTLAPSSPMTVAPRPITTVSPSFTAPDMSLLLSPPPGARFSGLPPMFSGGGVPAPVNLGAVGANGQPVSSGGVVGDIAGAAKKWFGKWATGQILGSGGGGGSPSGPSAYPGGAPINNAGMGGEIGALIGAGAKRIPGIVGGIVGYYVLDSVLGWIFKPGKIGHRRMNPLNPRALRRADRRVCAFGKIAAKELRSMGYTVARKHAKPLGKKRAKCR